MASYVEVFADGYTYDTSIIISTPKLSHNPYKRFPARGGGLPRYSHDKLHVN